MNKEKLLELAAFIEGQPFVHHNYAAIHSVVGFAFNMSSWLDPVNYNNETSTSCGTVGCIAGSAIYLFCPEEAKKYHSEVEVTEILGFTDIDDDGYSELADELFYPAPSYNWQSITPDIAAKCIRNLVETGKVDWSAAGAKLAVKE